MLTMNYNRVDDYNRVPEWMKAERYEYWEKDITTDNTLTGIKKFFNKLFR